jgi:hypothetical protein
MILREEDYQFGKKAVDATLGLDGDRIESHIRESVSSFSDRLDLSNMDDRHQVFQFLQYMSSLYLNYCLNGDLFLLSEEKIEKCHKSREVIVEIIKDFKENKHVV